ncbi:15003_t:CDS:10 [Entrophospora sp. SA101]|nr:15003_t:CDS:10 [Entrophospora sp. SA101]
MEKKEGTTMKSFKENCYTSRLWKCFLGVYYLSVDEYTGYLRKGKSCVYDKIRDDTFRTLATDQRFLTKVNEEMLIQITYVQGMNVLAAPFLFVMPELDAFYSFSAFIQHFCPLYVTPNLEGENVELNQRRVRFSRENSHRRRQSTTTASYQLNEQSFFRSASRNRTLKMVLLTQCIAGLQFTWAVELSYGTPYLLSIGLSKSLMSLVWVAGPLSGLLMQPIVGALSDNSTSRFGRRRPFMVIGSLIVAIALMFIGWTQEIVYSLVDEESPTSLTLKKILAVFSFYLLDFAINAIQASCRALIVDSLSTSQQEEGTAWAGRMIGIGGVAGYFMGFIDLPAVFPFLGGTQLQVLCALASIILLSSIGITCWTISEKVLQRSMGVRKDKLGDSTRIGSLTLLIYSIVSMMASVVLPFLVNPSDSSSSTTALSNSSATITSKIFRLPIPWLTLPRLWTISHFIFGGSMLLTLFVTEVYQADFLFSLVGISWAVSMWAPFSILGEVISMVPQFLVTFISSVIFAILESNNNDGGGRSDSIGFMLRFGGIMAIFAGFLSIRLWK